MTDTQDSTAKQKPDSEYSPQDKTASSQKPTKKRNKTPKFNEEDLYKVKYDF